jgi:ankyrin repeat protein
MGLLFALGQWGMRGAADRDRRGMPEAGAMSAISVGDTRKLRAEAERLDPHIYGPGLICNAAAQGQCEAIRTLVQMGVDPNGDGGAGLTPLMSAALAGHADAVSCLLDAGADPNRRLPSGQTALTLAERGGHEQAASVLRARAESDGDKRRGRSGN